MSDNVPRSRNVARPIYLPRYRMRKNEEKFQQERQAIALEKRLARKKAEILLRSHLTLEQQRDLDRFGFFKINVRGQVFRIRRGSVQNIDVVEPQAGKADVLIKTVCAHTQKNNLPDADEMLMQKLYLETNPDEFLGIANHMQPVPAARRCNERMDQLLVFQQR